MRIAALFDIHGNLPALEATLHACREDGAGAVVIGGDVALGPMPSQTLELVMALGRWVVPLQGDADRRLVAAYDLHTERRDEELAAYGPALAWAARRITGHQRDWLAGLPDHAVLGATDLGDIYFAHRPPGTERAMLQDTPESALEDALREVKERLCVVGGAHRAYDRMVAGRRIVCPGSVGIPSADAPGAYWAAFGPTVELRRTEYDIARAARRIARTGMPSARALADALRSPEDLKAGEQDLFAPGRQ